MFLMTWWLQTRNDVSEIASRHGHIGDNKRNTGAMALSQIHHLILTRKRNHQGYQLAETTNVHLVVFAVNDQSHNEGRGGQLTEKLLGIVNYFLGR